MLRNLTEPKAKLFRLDRDYNERLCAFDVRVMKISLSLVTSHFSPIVTRSQKNVRKKDLRCVKTNITYATETYLEMIVFILATA